MKRRSDDRTRRPASREPGGYPSLREHLTSRRDFLTWTGASVAAAASMVACISGDEGGDAFYVESRLPALGELAIELTGEGVLTAHVDLVCTAYHSLEIDTDTLTEVTIETIGAYTYAELTGLFEADGAPAQHRALEEELEAGFNAALGQEGERYTVALTLVALTV